MRIAKIRCPDCGRDTDCGVEVTSVSASRVLCAWCGRYYDRASSPRIFGAIDVAGSDGSDAHVIREFPDRQFRGSP